MAVRSIADVHSRIDDIVRKQRGVYLTPAQRDRALDDAQKQTFQDYYDIYLQTKVVPAALEKFKITSWFASDSTGFISYPANLEHLIQLYTVAGSTIYEVREVTEQELPTALKSQLRAVSSVKPIGHPLTKTEVEGYQLYPQSTQLGTMIYFRSVTTPVYAYTQVGRVITYDANASTQLDFGDAYVDKIISKALTYFGISMNEKDIIEFGNMKDQQTTT